MTGKLLRPDAPAADVDDAALMSRLRADDAAALDELVAQYWRPLVAYARERVGDEDAAVDVAQETFVRLWQRRRLWDAGGSVRAWLYRTARNLGISEYRKREVRERWAAINGGAADRSAARTPLQDAQDAEVRKAVAAALERLPERRREAFTLYYLRDLSYAEAADVMGIRPQSVANHLQAALADLRAELGRFFPALATTPSPDLSSDSPSAPPADIDPPLSG